MTQRILSALAIICCFCSPAAAADRGMKVQDVLGTDAPIPAYYALVIGINDYQYWPDLRQAKDDAEEVAKLVKTNYGFKEVRTLFDKQANLDGIIKELRGLARVLGPNDSLLLYYAGHGYYDKLLKKGYWVPSEAHESINEEPATGEWLPNTTLKEYLDVMKARHILVISDSCFSGAMMRGGRVEIEAKGNAWYRRAISQPSRWCVASGDLETVPDQSVFARKFLQVLQYPRQAVFSASDMAGWIKNDVAELSGTQPVFGPMKSSGSSEVGEFVFLQEGGKMAPGRSDVPTGPVQPAGPVSVARPPSGTLMVDSPVDGFVSINGGTKYAIVRSKSLKWQDMPVGKYTVVVTSGKRTWQDSVDVRDGEVASLVARGLEGEPAPTFTPRPSVPVMPSVPQATVIQLYITPSEASVSVDGAVTKERKIEVTPGERHAIKVEAEGYEPYFGESTVPAGTTKAVNVRLQKKSTGGKTRVGSPMW